jgi:hypothetical protein
VGSSSTTKEKPRFEPQYLTSATMSLRKDHTGRYTFELDNSNQIVTKDLNNYIRSGSIFHDTFQLPGIVTPQNVHLVPIMIICGRTMTLKTTAEYSAQSGTVDEAFGYLEQTSG